MGKDIVIGSYGVLMILAVGVAAWAAFSIATRRGYRPGYFLNHFALTGAASIGGALGTGYLLFFPLRAGEAFAPHPVALVSWGGIIGGLGAMAFISLRWKEDFLVLGDIFAPASLLAFGTGRIGCFLAGCCYGVGTSCAMGVDFSGTGSPASLVPQPLVPVQLISAGFLLTAGILISILSAGTARRGIAFGAAVIVHSLFRFVIEFWRDDPRIFFLGLSDGQWFFALYFLFGFALTLYAVRRAGTIRGKEKGEPRIDTD
ncbi:MAG: prolipoprotein diacylglyceryl transferase [Spirochaetes bacterium]|nr:prolipoprotein diacylglyceryl transferase [Spirochaetota bacterium]